MDNNKELFDEAELRAEYQRLYREIGYAGLLRVLYEMTVGINVLLKVIEENNEKG